MNARPSPRLAAILPGYAWSTAVLVIIISALAMAGWIFSVDVFHRPSRPGNPSMNPLTAVAMMLAGISLALVIRKPPRGHLRRQIAIACAAVVLAVGILKFLGGGLPLAPDRWLFPVRSASNPMAPNTAGGFLCLGAALLLLDYPTRRGHPHVVFAILTAAAALLALTGYVQGVMWFYQVSGYIPMALSTAITFLLLGTAILAARPHLEPMATLLSETAGGVVARRLLPAATLLPLALGWLCLQGSPRLYDRGLSITLFSVLMTATFMALVWWNARFLRRLDVERRRAEQRVDEERHLLRSLIDNLPDMVFVKDREHHFLLNNLAHAQALGAADPESMLGKSDLDFFQPQQSQQFRDEERDVVRTGVALIDREQKIQDPAGLTRFLTVTKVPLRDLKGQIVGIVGIAHDISKRKRAEEERDRFFTLSVDLMCIAGFDGFFRRVNPAWEATLGYTPDELTSRPWIDFVHPDDVQATVAEGTKLALGAVTISFENRYRCKDGSFRWLSWTVVPIVADQIMYAVARDITQRRENEDKLRETNQRLAEVLESELQAQQALRTAQNTMVQTEKLAGLGQMVAGVAHEINNPLSFVSNNVAVLQRDLRGILRLLNLYTQADAVIEQSNPSLAEQLHAVSKEMDFGYTLVNLQQLLERSREGLKRIQQIVKDLRDFARLDQSDLQEVNLNDGVRSTITIIQGHAKKRGISIKADLGDLPGVTCYPAKINQVIMNLLTNAIDASHDNSEVTISTSVKDQQTVEIKVSDTGTGIDPAIRGKIFDPFFTTKPPGQGTGLGLSISYGIVRDHGGKIDVNSAMGKGTTFTISLPVNVKAPPASS
ncbi:MAG TPA: PAS domain S-box protein [Tepidisphaeraceae bacterium]|jgi:PAS domain S-box-containing protein|nr:PAS domain S-box protein [Tepidisphaeraceae bacterium]